MSERNQNRLVSVRLSPDHMVYLGKHGGPSAGIRALIDAAITGGEPAPVIQDRPKSRGDRCPHDEAKRVVGSSGLVFWRCEACGATVPKR